MKFKPVLGSELSGSIGGIVASHNAGGAYFRNRVIPTNPGTAFQTAIRSFVGQLTSLWLNTLTPAERAAWDLYAANVPLLDALGEPINVSGLNMYVRSNTPRLQAALPRQDTAPGTFNLGDFTPAGMTNATTAGQTFDITFEVTDDWVGENDAAMLVYGSRPQNPSINYFKGPYRYADAVLGDAITPPTSPATMATPFAFVLGQVVHTRVQVSRADGRLSLSQRLFSTAVA